MSNVGKWDQWYAGLDPDEPQPYGDTTTYDIAEGFLAGLDVEDWGCGKGYFRTVHHGGYLGIDGSQTPFADKIVNLCAYKSATEGILLRHVIEHNDAWEFILVNALMSAEKRIVLVLFTPMVDSITIIARPADIGVPDIAFPHETMMGFFDNFNWTATWEDHATATQYGTERVYLLERC